MLILGILGGLWVALLIIRLAGMPQRHRQHMVEMDYERARWVARQEERVVERAAAIEARLAAPCPNPVWEPDYVFEEKK